MQKPIVINLFGSPSAGKSTTAAGVFYELKRRGIRCELVTEYAKSRVWEESFKTLDDQIYVFAKQQHKMSVLKGKVDIIITDSPLLLSLYYGKNYSSNFKNLINEIHNEYENINYYIYHLGEYDEVGRMQTKEESLLIGENLINILKNNDVEYITLNKDSRVVETIVNKTIQELNEHNLN